MNKLDARTKWTYSIGSVGRDAGYTLVSMFFLTYIQYTMNLTVAQFSVLSFIMVAALVWDAINDLLMGMIIENKRFKWGKFKPWILIGAVLNAIVIVIMFSFHPQGWAFVAAFAVLYVFWGMTYTMNDISYYGLLPSLTSDPKERNQLITLMNIFISIGQFSVAVAVPALVAGNAVQMYRNVAFVVALCFIAFQAITAFGVVEKPRRQEEKLTLQKMYGRFRENDQLVTIGIAALFYYIGAGLLILFGMNFFYMEFGYAEGGAYITMFTVMYGLGTLASQFMFPLLTKWLSRSRLLTHTYGALLLFYGLFLSIGYVLPKEPILIYMIGFFIFFFHGLGLLLMVVMINNTIEYAEYHHGYRHDSVISAVRSFAVKLATGIDQGIVVLVLILSGVYGVSQKISALEVSVGTGTMTKEQALDAAGVAISQVLPYQTFVLRLGIVLFPILAFTVMYWVTKRKYTIDEEMYEELLRGIETKKLSQ